MCYLKYDIRDENFSNDLPQIKNSIFWVRKTRLGYWIRNRRRLQKKGEGIVHYALNNVKKKVIRNKELQQKLLWCLTSVVCNPESYTSEQLIYNTHVNERTHHGIRWAVSILTKGIVAIEQFWRVFVIQVCTWNSQRIQLGNVMTSDLTTQCKKVPWYGNRGTQVQVSKPNTVSDNVERMIRQTFYIGITLLTDTN